MSDFWPHGSVAEQYGVFRAADGHTERALFVIDRVGVIQYIDIHDIDDQPDNEVLRNVVRHFDPGAAAREPKRAPADLSKLPHGGIVMYCTRWCSDCRDARAWLKNCGLPYTEVDIYDTPGAEEQVRLWNGGSMNTPTFDIDGTIVSDFNEERLRDVLGIDRP